MAELPVREQDIYSWGAAVPGTGHTVSTPDRIELCILTEESTAHCKCPVSPQIHKGG